MSLNTEGSTCVVDGSGATILFTDGSKMYKNVKIDIDANSDGFRYSAFITLTQLDLATLSNKKIKKFRLYIFDQEIESTKSKDFTEYVKCIMKAI